MLPSSPSYDPHPSLNEWYKGAFLLLFCVLGISGWIFHGIIYHLQEEVQRLQREYSHLLEQLDTEAQDESLKYGMLRSLLMSLQEDMAFYQKQLETLQRQQEHMEEETVEQLTRLQKQYETYQEDQKETLQHILDVYQSTKKWMDNEKQRQKVWYDKDTDTYVLSTEVEHNVFVHEAFTFRHGDPGYSYGGYLGRFASTKKYADERHPHVPQLAMPMDARLRGNPTLSPFLTDWMNQEE